LKMIWWNFSDNRKVARYHYISWIFGIITLLPRKKNASRMEHYSLIWLLNVSLKVFIKFQTNPMMWLQIKLYVLLNQHSYWGGIS
jgi:hypothetical protein